MKDGWTDGSGHGPQWGTWALMSGRMNKSIRSKGNFMVESDICYLQGGEEEQNITYSYRFIAQNCIIIIIIIK